MCDLAEQKAFRALITDVCKRFPPGGVVTLLCYVDVSGVNIISKECNFTCEIRVKVGLNNLVFNQPQRWVWLGRQLFIWVIYGTYDHLKKILKLFTDTIKILFHKKNTIFSSLNSSRDCFLWIPPDSSTGHTIVAAYKWLCPLCPIIFVFGCGGTVLWLLLTITSDGSVICG